MSVTAAITDQDGIVTNVILLNDLAEHPGAVACPAHVGIGMAIDTPAPDTTPTIEQISIVLQARVQQYMDAQARLRRWDNIRSAAIRAGYPGPYQAEGIAYATWMDACWAHCYQVLADVVAGLRLVPTEAELIAELPQLVLPQLVI